MRTDSDTAERAPIDLGPVRRVLVPMDGSAFARRPAAVAADLAARLMVDLEYLAVVDDAQDTGGPRDDLSAHVDGGDLPDAAITVRVGADPSAVVVERAAATQSLVVMSSHGRGRLAGSVLGSVAEQVVRRRGAPVVVVGPQFAGDQWTPIERLVVCLDGSPVSETALPVATTWARMLDLPIELVHVISPDVPAELDTLRLGDVHESNYLARVARGLRSEQVTAEWEVLHDDDPAAAIVRYLEDRPGSLLTLSTHSRSGLERLALGSVTSRLVRRSPVPLLLLHPPEPTPD